MAALLFFVLAGWAAFYYFYVLPGAPGGVVAGETAPDAAVEPPPPPVEEVAALPMLAIVIDDLGGSVKRATRLISLDAPITLAIIPHLRNSREVAEAAHSAGREVILHVPMEPKDMVKNDPGKGALLTTMTEDEVTRVLKGDLDAVPHVSGVNNHMGSRFTENVLLMTAVLTELKGRGKYFLDSRTTGSSVALKVAREVGVGWAGRSVFLDNERDEDTIKAQLMKTVAIAKKRGEAIAIGHPYPETLAVLEEVVPGLAAYGVEVVTLSRLVRGAPE